ncbi:EamA family transporter [Chitinibacter sp. FCG-7]|uniref:EamA family transporter n=1 Tax=Chitinibacter mangrovi TaxID=3153927 RepID=A0AAU7FDK4_9NEIS
MKSSLASGYALLIVIWSTTALAIKWGVSGIPFTLALMVRFDLAAVLGLLLLLWRKQSLPLDREHCRAYAIAGIATALSMLCSFWAAQFVASGLIAVLYGLAPLATGLFAARWLDSPLRRAEWLAILLSLSGLAIIFSQHLNLSPAGLPGMAVLLLGMTLQSGAAVLLKRYASTQSALSVNAGALLVCAGLSTAFWLIASAPLPAALPGRALGALIYLASIGSVLAFSLYYWLIRECRPISVALISLITPASSLWLGHWLNHETVQWHELAGTALIMLGLSLHILQSRR